MTADLYELIDHAAGWRMPIRVRWTNPALAEVTFADISYLLTQEEAIIAKLDSAGGAYRHNETWYIPKLSLQDMAIKSDEPNPERLVRWTSPEPDIDVQADFVHAYCHGRFSIPGFRDPETVAHIWASLQKFMLHWLVAEGRAIDFGFGRLDALPLRANWKEYIIGRLFKRCDSAKHNRERYTAEEYEFFRRNIACNTEWLTAYDLDSRTMRWSVEFMPGKRFHAATDKREEQRIAGAKKWKTNYLAQMLKALREPGMVERLYANIVAYSKETNFPFAIFPDGSSPRCPPTGYHPTRSTTAWVQVHLVTAAAADGHEGSALVSEDASVPKVSDLRSQTKDVRQRDEMDGTGEG